MNESGNITGNGKTGDVTTAFTNRRYITVKAKKIDHKEIRLSSLQGPYKLEQLMARGAESVLYLGYCMGRQVCIKAVRNKLNRWIGDSTTRSQEEKLESVSYKTKLRHINNEYAVAKTLYADGELPIVHIYALRRVTRMGLEMGYDLIMEYLRGHDLADKILSKTLTTEDKMNVFVQAIRCLDYLHKRKFIHLDIKPSNFMLVADKVKLVDFGVTVLSGYKPKAITGTGGYLSPEQICKEMLDETTDMFALGITFSVFFGGKALNQPQSSLVMKQTRVEAKYHLTQDAHSVIGEIPELVDYPEFADIIRRCSIPMREKRIPNCAALLHEIREWSYETGVKLTFL